MRSRYSGGDGFHQLSFIFCAGDEDFAGDGFFQFFPKFDELIGRPTLEGVFRAGMDGDPWASGAGGKVFLRFEIEREGLG